MNLCVRLSNKILIGDITEDDSKVTKLEQRMDKMEEEGWESVGVTIQLGQLIVLMHKN